MKTSFWKLTTTLMDSKAQFLHQMFPTLEKRYSPGYVSGLQKLASKIHQVIAQKMTFSVKDFFSKNFLQICK